MGLPDDAIWRIVADAKGPDRAAFFVGEPIAPRSQIPLSEGDAHHIQVLRIGVGERVALRNGAGTVASGLLVRVGRTQALVEVDQVRQVDPAPPIHLIVPIADRDRMLWLAEKAAELNVASWRPVLWERSRSVSPRGEGATFRTRLRARMIAALLQSRSAWLPEIYPDAKPDRAIAAAPAGTRLVLDAGGGPVRAIETAVPITIAVGPEGGFETTEVQQLETAGFIRAGLGASILRFETATIVGVAVARSMLESISSNNS